MSNPNPSPSTRFKPGAEWKGNANGRPKGKSLTTWLQDIAAEVGTDGTSKAECVAKRLMELAIGGDVKAIKLVFDRHDGRIPLHVQLEQIAKAYDVVNCPGDL